ncbi:hypothetical protein R5R35_001735 [Gryllus longicercus]|uniref:Leucine-rich melanocyte differentiation-associated protein n=1 Tax=Gryllus longicercus TaxID=2509291 RepID=A0AAN9ZEZ6_9ORTH
MTSLGKLVFIDQRTGDDDSYLTAEDQRLTLAYENLEEMPQNLVYNFGSFVRILDLSHNKFRCLDFLCHFENLSSLILDHNEVDSNVQFPSLPSLKLLWLNHNKIKDLFPFIRNLNNSVPNLKYLSLMGNAAAPSYLNGGTFYEYLQYRLFVISWFPNLIHLDDRVVSEDQKNEAHRLFRRPFLERLSISTSRSSYLRVIQEKFVSFFGSVERYFPNAQNARNTVI